MKYHGFIFLIAAFLTGCSKSPEAPYTATARPPIASADPSQYPTLVIDPEHQVEASNTPAIYQFGAAPGVRLDAAQFKFAYGTNSITQDMIQVVLDDSHIYKLLRPTVTNLYVIDRSTLEPLRGGPFAGFHSGDHGMLAIGRAESGKPAAIFVSWVGKFQVK